MSMYEMLNYDNLLTRIGIPVGDGSTWFCGSNQAESPLYDQPGATFDQPNAAYTGNSQGHAALCLSEDVNVNGLLLNHRDQNGTIWLCTGIEGWWTTPSPEITDVPAPYWDGSMLTTGRYTARTITITGCFIPPDPSLVWYNRDAIIRAASIVRGIGLLATCGNESPTIKWGDPFYDPPKMSIIQSADVPLIETTKTSGFTQFSLSFRCPYPTKLSTAERYKPLALVKNDVTMTRYYTAFSTAEVATTSYDELRTTMESEFTKRLYGDVLNVNPDSLIADEELTKKPASSIDTTRYLSTGGDGVFTFPSTTVHNSGNYFAFPIFVFGEIRNPDIAHPDVIGVTVKNLTTGETMVIRKRVPTDWKLVVDTGLRRVVIANPTTSPYDWVWDDRSALTLTSQWISLAPGDNEIMVTMAPGTEIRGERSIYFRDTWIG